MKRTGLVLLVLDCVTLLAACDSGSAKRADKIRIGASPTPHAEILEHIKPESKKEGVELKIVRFDDYVLPNKTLGNGDIDVNYFSTVPYFNLRKKEDGYQFLNVGAIHLKPMGIYSHRTKKIAATPDGVKVIVSNVPSEWGRVLNIPVKDKLIKIEPGIQINQTTFEDITENPKSLVFDRSVDSTLLTSAYENNERDLVAINSSFTCEEGLNPARGSLTIEQNDSPYANIVTTKATNEGNKDIETVIETLRETKVQQRVEKKWSGSITPMDE